MNIRRRDFILGLASAGVGGSTVTGCKYIPSAAKIALIALSVGKAAGLVCKQCKIDDKSRAIVIEIMGKVRSCIPATVETFEKKWTDIAREHTQKLVDEGRITPTQGQLIMAAFVVVVKGVSYLFMVRFPKAREFTDLVLSGVCGFCDGFLTTFTPSNVESDECTDCDEKTLKAVGVDAEAYRFLIKYRF